VYDRRVATYKQPRRINVVSVLVVLAVLAAGFVGYRAWPVISLRADVKDAFLDALPRLYRANLLPEPEASVAAAEVRKTVVDKLATLGIADAERALSIGRSAEEVAITIELRTAIDLGPVGPRVPVSLSPRAATSAARVSY
jgi:hypothetical protein